MTTAAKSAHLEETLEGEIEAHLLAHGWQQGLTTSYDRDLALDTVELFTFIGATQHDTWEKLIGRDHADDQGLSRGTRRRGYR